MNGGAIHLLVPSSELVIGNQKANVAVSTYIISSLMLQGTFKCYQVPACKIINTISLVY